MEKFDKIFARAAKRKGGDAALEELLPKPKSPAQLKRTPDDRYLAEMTRCIFRSGFVWQVIENKWAGFEEAFAAFDPHTCAMLSDEELERLSRDTRIVRHAKKIASVRGNAQLIRELAAEHGTFGKWLAAWPVDDIVGLWDELKRRGDRLGGGTGAFFLRFSGKDTFMLSPDVVKALRQQKVIDQVPSSKERVPSSKERVPSSKDRARSGKDKVPSSKKALAAVQAAFNQWHEESDRPLCQISRVLAASVP